MSGVSDEGRVYNVRRVDVDGERLTELSVYDGDGRLITRDHLCRTQTGRLAAELVFAAEEGR